MKVKTFIAIIILTVFSQILKFMVKVTLFKEVDDEI